jgi:SAM-dependent methyltransferase
LINRGRALASLRRMDEAVASFDQALAIKPGDPYAHFFRATALSLLGRSDEALAAHRRAASIGMEFAPPLISALLRGRLHDEARAWLVRALAARETQDLRTLFVQWQANRNFAAGDAALRGHLLRAITEPWGRPAELALSCALVIKTGTAVAEALKRLAPAGPAQSQLPEWSGGQELEAIASDPLIPALLHTTSVPDIELERLFTILRSALLDAAVTSAVEATVSPAVLALYGAIARQCFINEYVYDTPDTERKKAQALKDSVAAALQAGAEISALRLVAVAAYFPLHAMPNAEILLARQWPEAVTGVLHQQVREPLEENRLRSMIPVLTPIEDNTSMLVREQYEQNPYPRWAKVAPAAAPMTVNQYIHEICPRTVFTPSTEQGDIEILIAGCGTGQQSIDVARRFRNAAVLAVDLSLASLSYAERQTRALGLENIRYAQADIVRLGSIGRTFDLIESAGVLHHLADPLAGWKTLLSLLRPGGFMMVALYSELARQDIVAARSLIAERGYRSTPDDIRRLRRDIVAMEPNSLLRQVATASDFFATSECRDLLFHVQEHRFTLPAIDAFLKENDLNFLGFMGEGWRLQDYQTKNPQDRTLTDLSLWHQYEQQNPDTFRRMYQFWVQKKS